MSQARFETLLTQSLCQAGYVFVVVCWFVCMHGDSRSTDEFL